MAAAALRIVLGDYLIDLITDLITGQFWPPAATLAGADETTDRVEQAVLALLLVWASAAFGEEIAYRGLPVQSCRADLGGGSTTA